jgi:bacterioferritin
MIEEFIIDEQDHFNWVRRHLCVIEQIGMDNYMIEMLGE